MKIVVHEMKKVSAIDGGLNVCLHAATPTGEPMQVVLPHNAVATAVQALLAGDELARGERRKAGGAAADDVGFALEIGGFHVTPTKREARVGLGFRLKHGGVLGFALSREDALRVADLLTKWAKPA
jgi:hypothetical protein